MSFHGGLTGLHLYKSSRAVPSLALSSALNLRSASKFASVPDLRLPAQAFTLSCPQCSTLWVPGLTLCVRIKIGSPSRTSGGLSKRGRARRLKRSAQHQSLQDKPQASTRRRPRTLVYQCLNCSFSRAVSQLAHEPLTEPPRQDVPHDTAVASTTTPVTSKKRAKNRKEKSSLKFLLDKGKQDSSRGIGNKLDLSDFFKPG